MPPPATIFVMGFSTSGGHEESPSVDIEVFSSPFAAAKRLCDIVIEQEGDKEICEEAQRWAGKDDLFIDDEMGTIYYILKRKIGQVAI